MDTEDNNFIIDISENMNEIELFLTCPKCKNIFTEPTILLQCAHTFCKSCLDKTRRCPECGGNFESRDMLSNHQINYMKNCFIHMRRVISKQTLQDKIENIPVVEVNDEPVQEFRNNTNNLRTESVQHGENFVIEQIDSDAVTVVKCIWMNATSKQDFCKKNHLGETELQKACIQNKPDAVRSLISKGACVNVVDNFKWSPLHEVAKSGNVEICKLILDAGSILDIPNIDYKTPLHSAAEYKQSKIVKLLLEYGADSDLMTYDGIRMLDICPDMEQIVRNTKRINDVIPCIYETNIVDPVFAKHQKSKKGKSISKAMNVVTEKTTHFILNDPKILESVSVPLLKAIVQGLWIVDDDWYAEYVENKKNIDPRPFEMKWTGFKSADESVFRKSRINRQLLRPRLFSGCKIYLHGVKYHKNGSTFTKEQIVDIIRAGDGEVLKRCPKPECIPRDKLNYPFHARANKLDSCSHFIVYLTEKPYQPEYKFKELRTLPVSWIVDCILKHRIIDPDEFSDRIRR